MPGLSKQRALEELRARIETIEKRPLLSGQAWVAGPRLLALPPGALHEVFADEHRNTGAALGFALAAARGQLTAERPAILVMQLVRDSQDLGVPYGAGLKTFGVDPECVVLCRPETLIELLWAIEEAIACRAVAAVVADIGSEVKALDFTASRRLSLRTAAAGSSVFLIRYGQQREATAARLRWRIGPTVSSEPVFDARAPGGPRWRVELEKGRLGSKGDPTDWMLDWTEDGFVLAKPQGRSAADPAAGAPLSGAPPAALGDRLSQAG